MLAGEDGTNPYECAIDQSVAEGAYLLQATAIDETAGVVSFSAAQPVLIFNQAGVPQFSSVIAACGAGDCTDILLAGLPVVAGTTPSMDGAFYVEDPARTAAVRVETSESIMAGRMIAVRGVLRQNASLSERYIEATDVWDLGPATLPEPLMMTNLALGGAAPAGVPGVLNGHGAYNVGLLVRVWGKVTYMEDDILYIDDGSWVSDGNTLLGPYVVSLQGGAIPDPVPHPAPKGVSIRCLGLDRPHIGDLVTITGISSLATVGESLGRLVRPRTQADIRYSVSYINCHKVYGEEPPFRAEDGTIVPLGSNVRLVHAWVMQNLGDYVSLMHIGDMGLSAFAFAQTQLASSYSIVTVPGTSVAGAPQGHGDNLIADAIYLGGSTYGANRMEGWLPYGDEWYDQPINPVGPVPLAAAEILASSAFLAQDSRPGCIGWALAQPDGTVVTLRGESITSVTDAGHCLALREWFEPETDTPRLVLQLTGTAPGLTEWNQVDITGTLATLSNGQRALVYPSAVYRWDSQSGLPTLLVPKSYDDEGNPEVWPWRTLVYPQ